MSSKDVAVILLAGGTGSRFGGDTPKQFLPLGGRPLITHSFEQLSKLQDLAELVVVCDPQYRCHFPEGTRFALPGERRQDSVYHGLLALKSDADYVCIHDGARPFVSDEMIGNVLDAARAHGAAAAGMPVKYTVKQHGGDHFVVDTPDRSRLWEIQTPQIMRRDWLQEGFQMAIGRGITATDDTSLIELAGHPVKLVEGSYSNIKVTTREDMAFASHVLSNY